MDLTSYWQIFQSPRSNSQLARNFPARIDEELLEFEKHVNIWDDTFPMCLRDKFADDQEFWVEMVEVKVVFLFALEGGFFDDFDGLQGGWSKGSVVSLWSFCLWPCLCGVLRPELSTPETRICCWVRHRG